MSVEIINADCFVNGNVYTYKVDNAEKAREHAEKIWSTGYRVKVGSRHEWFGKHYIDKICWDGEDETFLAKKYDELGGNMEIIIGCLDPDEVIEFGLYNNGNTNIPKEWKELTKVSANNVIQLVQTYVEYYGSIYGNIHSLFKGANPQYFTLREALTGELVKCLFERSYYPEIVKALKNQNSIVYAFGRITSNIVSKTIENISVSNIKIAPDLSDEDYKAFFGCAPNIKHKGLYDR